MPSRRNIHALAVAGLLAAVGLFVAAATSARSSTAQFAAATSARSSAAQAAVATIAVGAPTSAPAIPSGFVGVSIELTALGTYAGTDPQAVNPVFEQLIRNLSPQRPVIRIGGDSTDWAWYPVRGMARPPWVRYTLTPTWMAVARSLATAVDGRLFLGLNFEADSARIAGAEARAMVSQIGRQRIGALELGNEPELYSAYNWYHTPEPAHIGIKGRPPGWNPQLYAQQLGSVTSGIPAGVPVAGPSIGSAKWSAALPGILGAARRISVVTLHRYPTQRCAKTTVVPASALLARTASDGMAANVAPYVRIAHRFGHPLRLDEMNAVSCGGEPGLSNTYATSLWSLDAMFAMAGVGVSGVNIHSTPKSVNHLFSVQQSGTQWSSSVAPLYYGLLMFAQAAPAGSHLLRTSGGPGGALRVWATRSGTTTHVVLINDSTARPATVTLKIRGAGGSASLERLQGPGLKATGGVTIGGQGFGTATRTGRLAGRQQLAAIAPKGVYGPGGPRYTVTVPPISAAMLTVG
jgi:hypothetical protein